MRNRFLSLLLLGLCWHTAHADLRLDALLHQGVSEYEFGHHEQALEHFTAALVHAVNSDLSRMYPAVYLCAIWHHGRGVEASRERAEAACTMVHGRLSIHQLSLFHDVLERNSGEQSPLPHKKALADAASALAWYMESLR